MGLIIEGDITIGYCFHMYYIEWVGFEEEFLCQCCMKAGLPQTVGTKEKYTIQSDNF